MEGRQQGSGWLAGSRAAVGWQAAGQQVAGRQQGSSSQAGSSVENRRLLPRSMRCSGLRCRPTGPLHEPTHFIRSCQPGRTAGCIAAHLQPPQTVDTASKAHLQVRNDGLAAQLAVADHLQHGIIPPLRQRQLEHVLAGVDLRKGFEQSGGQRVAGDGPVH